VNPEDDFKLKPNDHVLVLALDRSQVRLIEKDETFRR